jgi:hypothetical protein
VNRVAGIDVSFSKSDKLFLVRLDHSAGLKRFGFHSAAKQVHSNAAAHIEDARALQRTLESMATPCSVKA